jgi:hypothetical protein
MKESKKEKIKNFKFQGVIIMKNFIENTMNRTAYTMACASIALRRRVTDFMKGEDGETNLVAILLIIIVTVGLVGIFKDKLTNLINKLFKTIETSTAKI